MTEPARETTPRGHIFRNWLSLSGAVLAASAVFAFLLLWAIDLLASSPNPYMGILSYVVAPGFLIRGLLLVTLGGWLASRRARQASKRAHVVTIIIYRTGDGRLL